MEEKTYTDLDVIVGIERIVVVRRPQDLLSVYIHAAVVRPIIRPVCRVRGEQLYLTELPNRLPPLTKQR